MEGIDFEGIDFGWLMAAMAEPWPSYPANDSNRSGRRELTEREEATHRGHEALTSGSGVLKHPVLVQPPESIVAPPPPSPAASILRKGCPPGVGQVQRP